MTNRLKAIREKMGMNMREFARFLDVKYTTYVGYENGAREPGGDFLTHLARLCGTTTDYLLGLTEADGLPPQPVIISVTGTEDPLRTMLPEAEYALLTLWRTADARAREDAMMVLQAHPAGGGLGSA